MRITDLTRALEHWAPAALQEDYDNSGLLTGEGSDTCTGVLCCLDVTIEVINEAVARNCNLVVAHHPLIFKGLKKLNGNHYAVQTLLHALRHNIAVYALHTNLDNVLTGVNRQLALRLGLDPASLSILLPRQATLCKLTTYVPSANAADLRDALFAAGAGEIGDYRECSFNTEGIGTFRPLAAATPAIGQAGGPQEQVNEIRIEMILPVYLQQAVTAALHHAHPYETPAFDFTLLCNSHPGIGSGMVGNLPEPVEPAAYLQQICQNLGLHMLRHTQHPKTLVSRVALCGGSGAFLIPQALASGAQLFVTADLKYHDFFEANDNMSLADIGHFESEQWAIAAIAEYLQSKFPTFAVLKTGVSTNPVQYLAGKAAT